MSCLGECWDLGPPPDTILFMPPPPVPSFFDQRLRDNLSSLPCGGGGGQLCGGTPSEWEPPKSERGDLPTLSAQDITTADDTWPLVLVAASVGVLVLGALLALFLLRCREQQSSKEQPHHPQHRIGGKASAASIAAAASSVPNGETTGGDSRAVCWAALTPRGGTQHFVSVDDEENHHYETVDGPWYRTNCGNYEYEEPALLTSPIPAWLQPQLQQQDMRCISTLRRPRPRVSPPTRIEHPNLPPLNLNPLPGPPPPPPPRRPSTMGMGTLSRRPSDANTLLKYNMN